MEAVFEHTNFNEELPFKEVMSNFFGVNTPESVKALFFKMFQCWVTKDCTLKAEISDEEIALFFDQLTDLVAAAYTVHQANRASGPGQRENGHE
ncbi:MAG: hypothetical protein ACHQHN_13860 [Sphingobacteriales bacterium]